MAHAAVVGEQGMGQYTLIIPAEWVAGCVAAAAAAQVLSKSCQGVVVNLAL